MDLLRERWRITAFVTDGSYHGFDLQTTQYALTDKPLLIQKYHYGGVAFRGRVRWLTAEDGDARKWEESSSKTLFREPSEFRNDIGSDRMKGNHEHARWVSFFTQNLGKPVTITVLCHRDNFRAPQAARLHPTKPYFVFSPCVDGEFIIDREHPFTRLCLTGIETVLDNHRAMGSKGCLCRARLLSESDDGSGGQVSPAEFGSE